MPATTEMERRDRALIAFTILTGARDGAIATFKLKHIDLVEGTIDQDAREVRTKFAKSFVTAFFPVGDDIRAVVVDWVNYLRQDKQHHLRDVQNFRTNRPGEPELRWRSALPRLSGCSKMASTFVSESFGSHHMGYKHVRMQ